MSNNPVCETIPNNISATYFKTGIKNFFVVEEKIKSYLSNVGINYTYDESFCSFKCIQTYDDGDERIDCITIFWNNITEEHVVESRRLKGDTFFHCTKNLGYHNIFKELVKLFLNNKS